MQRLPFRVAVMDSRRLQYLFRLGPVPQTVVLGREGRVRYAATGVLTNQAVIDSIYRAALDTGTRRRAKPAASGGG